MLVSRSAEKLHATADELGRAVPGRTFKCVAADFSQSVESGLYEGIAKELAGLQVAVLVNNVGVSYPGALFFHELAEKAPGLAASMIHVNVDAVTQMTAMLLPGMVERKVGGVIVNIGSAAGRMPIGNPLYAE